MLEKHWKIIIVVFKASEKSLLQNNFILRIGDLEATGTTKVISFLSGLDASYASTKNKFLSDSELPTLNIERILVRNEITKTLK